MNNVVPFPTPPPVEPLDLGQLFDQHHAWLRRACTRLSGRADLADDLVQEVFLVAWRRREEIEDRHGIRTWLYRVAVNVIRTRRRTERRYGNFLGRLQTYLQGRSRGDVDDDLDRHAHKRQVHAILQDLTPIQREIFVLFELEELEGPEIAQILDIPVNTVWSRLRVARAAFKKRWEAP